MPNKPAWETAPLVDETPGATPAWEEAPVIEEPAIAQESAPDRPRAYDSPLAAMGKAVTALPERTAVRLAGARQMLEESAIDNTLPPVVRGQISPNDMLGDVHQIGVDDPDTLRWAQLGRQQFADSAAREQAIQEALNRSPGPMARAAGIRRTAPQQVMDARRALDRAAPNLSPDAGPVAQFGVDAATALSDMVPVIATGLAGGVPAGLAMMGGQVAGDEYLGARESGRTPAEARQDTLAGVAFETVPEAIPLSRFLKEGSSLLRRVFEGALTEGATEAVTEALRAGYEKGVLDEDVSLADALKRMGYSALLGATVGGGIAAGTHPFVRRDDAPEAPEAPEAEPAPPRLGLPRPPVQGYAVNPAGEAQPIYSNEANAAAEARAARAADGLTPDVVAAQAKRAAWEEAPLIEESAPTHTMPDGSEMAGETHPQSPDIYKESPDSAPRGTFQDDSATKPAQQPAMPASSEKLPEPAPAPQFIDPRLKRPAFRKWIQDTADRDMTPGGGIAYLRDQKTGDIVGRSSSVNPKWAQDLLASTGMSVADVRRAAEKAARGERLGVRQARAVVELLDVISGERAEAVPYLKEEIEKARALRRQARQPRPATAEDIEAAAAGMPDYRDEDMTAGEIFEEAEYHPEMGGEARALVELFDDAKAFDEAAAEAAMESDDPATAARKLYQIIEANREKQQRAGIPERANEAGPRARPEEQRASAGAPELELKPQETRQQVAAKPEPKTGDIFGDDVATKQAVADATRAKDEARNGLPVPADTGVKGDLFSEQANRQTDIESAPKAQPVPDTAAIEAAKASAEATKEVADAVSEVADAVKELKAEVADLRETNQDTPGPATEEPARKEDSRQAVGEGDTFKFGSALIKVEKVMRSPVDDKTLIVGFYVDGASRGASVARFMELYRRDVIIPDRLKDDADPVQTETPKPAETAPASQAPGASDAIKKAGLVIRKTTTKNGNGVWEVGGDTRTHKDMLKALGGRWYGPKKVWSFYGSDPTDAIAKRLGASPQQPKPAAEPAAPKENSHAAEQAPTETRDAETDRGHGTERRVDSGPVAGRVAEANRRDGGGRDADPETQEPARDGDESSGRRENGREPESSGGTRDHGTVWGESSPVTTERSDYVITEESLGDGGPKTKYRNNVAAIRLLKDLTAADRKAAPHEQKVLAQYVGWGGLKAAFDPDNKQWSAEYQELKSLLNEEEYAAARRSILDAHYTSVPVVRSIWSALSRMGFTGGRVLEPSMGTGNFIGLMPAGIRGRSSIFGVELDRVTGAIARQLYQSAEIASPVGFQDVKIADGSFDAAIGNPPFGSQSLFDSERPHLKRLSIHNFFLAKSVESLRPGGIMGMVVSRYFMDAIDSSARALIAKNAKLIGAARLPYTAFKQNAGTEVVTDVVFFQRLQPGEKADTSWVNTGQITVDGKPFQINQYFIDNPGNVLGKWSLSGSMYADGQLNVETGSESIEDGLARVVESLPPGIYERVARVTVGTDVIDGMVPDGEKLGAYFIRPDGKLAMRVEDSRATDKDGNPIRRHVLVEMPKATEARARGLIGVRSALRALMQKELSDNATDAQLSVLRANLNRTYDAFVKKFGFINAQSNRRAFREDPSLPLLESLEPGYDPGVSAVVAKKRGVSPRMPTADKADIFKKRVLAPYREVTSAASPEDALSASLNEHGAVDLDYIAKLLDSTPEASAKALAGLIFENPATGTWEPADLYLSGNVKAKLATAAEAAKADSRFAANVEALQRVQPADIYAADIHVTLGAPWIPADVVTQFGQELLDDKSAKAFYMKAVGRWSFTARNNSSTASTATWGTRRVPAAEIIQHILSMKAIVVKDNHGTRDEPRWVVNEQETEAARAKSEDIVRKFGEWIWEDKARRERLEKIYNATMNTNREYVAIGDHLRLPGSSPVITLLKHQKSAVWRALQTRRLLLDHVVGAGKTFEMSAIAMELRRLGLARKPMFVVPNHLVRQWRNEFYKLYPNANVLATTESDFTKQNRARLFARIATGDWDAVIVAHSAFKRIGMPEAQEKAILGEMLSDLTSTIEQLKIERGDRNVLRDMERIKENLENKVKRLKESGGKKDQVATFDELGVDALLVDEAHAYKNLFYFSQMNGVAGLGSPEGSGRAFDMFVKMRYLQTQFGGKAATVFATGTPVSNSLVEMFTMQRYLDYDGLKARGIHLLDPWARVFGQVEQVYEVHPSGNGYRLSTRFSKFANMGELMTMYRGVADVVTLDDLKQQARDRGERYPVPNMRGGKPQMIVADRSDLQTRFFGEPEFGRDENGNIKFKYDALEVSADEKGKFQVVQQFGKHASKVAGPFETEAEAAEERDRLLAEPVVGYNKGSILWKFEHLRELTKNTGGKVNALSITNEARKAGLDYRLIDPNAPDFAGSKINRAVEKVLEVHKQWSSDNGTQLIFCDLSVPSSAKAKIAAKFAEQSATDEDTADTTEPAAEEESATEEPEEKISMDQFLATSSKFSVYDDLKAKLVARGIPAEQVAFIHDYDTAEKKAKLYAAVNAGHVRVLIGSTEKMGAGMNVQERLVAVHHLDAPWKPSDLEQRNGRIIRRGNKLYERDPDGFEIQEFRYATKQTYDTRMWQIIEHKARGIEQLRKASANVRTLEDIAGEAANSSDMKAAASGNPLILEEIKLRNEVRSLDAQRMSHNSSRYGLQSKAAFLEQAGARLESAQKEFDKWQKIRAANPGDPFSITLGGKTYTDRKDISGPFAAEIGRALKDPAKGVVWVGKYRGVRMAMRSASDDMMMTYISADGDNWRAFASYGAKDAFSTTGFLTRIDNFLKGIDAELEAAVQTNARENAELAKVREELAKPFPKTAELESAIERHRDVVRRLRSSGGGVSYTPAMRRELNEALRRRGLKPEPEAADDAAMFRRGRSEPGGLSVAAVRAAIDPIHAQWKNGPRIEVHATVDDIPADLREAIDSMDDAADILAGMEGVYWRGGVHIIADKMRDAEHVQFTLLHEALGHAGLRGTFGRELVPVLNRIYLSNAKVRAEAAKLMQRFGYDRVRATEEVLADMAGRGDTGTWWDQLVSFIRDWLRRHGFTLNISDADVRKIVADAGKFVTEGERAAVYPPSLVPQYSQQAPIFYSQMHAVLAEKLPNAGPAPAIRSAVKAYADKGLFKKEEYEWLGVDEWLGAQQGRVTREQVLDFVRANQVDVKEVVKSTDDAIAGWIADPAEVDGDWNVYDASKKFIQTVAADSEAEAIRAARDNKGANGETKFDKWQLPGGENYRELLLTLPTKRVTANLPDLNTWLRDQPWYLAWKSEGENWDKANSLYQQWFEREERSQQKDSFYSSHFDEPNILAHVRFNERTDADGNRILFIEEVQSDWHQKGRREGYADRRTSELNAAKKEYEALVMSMVHRRLTPTERARIEELRPTVSGQGRATTGVPDAPFKTTWPLLAMKRMIRYAAENGFDRIAWTTGEQQAARYDLSKQVDAIRVQSASDPEKVHVMVRRKGHGEFERFGEHSSLEKSKLPDVIGKEIAAKALARIDAGEDPADFSGVDLKVGGEGMRKFYDAMLPSEVNKYVRKWGAKVGQSKIDTGTQDEAGTEYPSREPVHSLDITPAMRDSVMQGQPLFARAKPQTETEAFRKWFAGSKVVDESGKPLVVYHATTRDFSEFAPGGFDANLSGPAIWFSPRADYQPAAHNVLIGQRVGKFRDGTRVIPAYVKIARPLIVDATTRGWAEDRYGKEFPQLMSAEVVERLKNDGYDGVLEYSRDKLDPSLREVVAFRPEQIKSAIGNRGTFDPDSSDIRFSRAKRPSTGNAALDSALNKMGGNDTKPPLKDRFNAALGSIREAVNGELTQGLVDQFYGIKLAEGDVSSDRSGYIATRMSTGLPAQVHAMLLYGPLKWSKDGSAVVDPNGKGLIKILEPVADKLDLWAAYMVGRRAQRLMGEGRENLFDRNEITAMIALGAKHPEFVKAANEWAAFNKAMLDFAEAAGLIDPEKRALWAHADYIPFYRIIDAVEAGPRARRGLAGQTSGIKTLTGGTANLNDLVENMVMNSTHLLKAAMRNRAAVQAVSNMEQTGLATPAAMDVKAAIIPLQQFRKVLKDAGVDPDTLPPQVTEGLRKMWSVVAPTGKDVVRVMRGGKAHYYHIHDALAYRALTAINKEYWGKWMEVFRAPKRLVTDLITADPSFMAANFVRDTLQAFVIGRDPMTPALSGVSGLVAGFRNDPDLMKVWAAGGGFHGGYSNAHDPKAVAKEIRSILRNKGISPASIIDSPKKLWSAWQDFGSKFENANRLAVYQAAKRAGKSDLEAAFESKDFMDFSMRGDYAVVQFLAETVPLLNARLQGLYRNGKGAIENPRAFAIKGSLVMLAGLAVYLRYRDDERYKKLEDWEKNTYYHFWIGDAHFRIPKPFEVGAIFGTIPERITEFFIEGVMRDNPKAGAQFWKNIGWVFGEMFNLGSMRVGGVPVPAPQTVVPILETWANYDSFTERPVVGLAYERLLPEAQYDAFTSATAIEIGKAAGLSPMQLEHLWRGYFGTLGGYALGASDMVTRRLHAYPDQPSMRLEDMPVIKRFYQGMNEPRHTRYTTELYDLLKEADAVYATVNRYRREGDADAAREIIDENRDLLRKRVPLNAAANTLGNINKAIKRVHADRTLTPEEKRRRIDELTARKNRVAQQVIERVQ